MRGKLEPRTGTEARERGEEELEPSTGAEATKRSGEELEPSTGTGTKHSLDINVWIWQRLTELLVLAARCHWILYYEWIFLSIELTDLYICIKVFFLIVVKVDSMVGHHIGPNQMLDRSSCLSLSANGSTS